MLWIYEWDEVRSENKQTVCTSNTGALWFTMRLCIRQSGICQSGQLAQSTTPLNLWINLANDRIINIYASVAAQAFKCATASDVFIILCVSCGAGYIIKYFRMESSSLAHPAPARPPIWCPKLILHKINMLECDTLNGIIDILSIDPRTSKNTWFFFIFAKKRIHSVAVFSM